MKLKGGEYRNKEINTVPLDYLIWFFNAVERNKKDIKIHLEILKYFLSLNIDIRKISFKDKYGFYFIDHKQYDTEKNEIPFLETIAYHNSKGEHVYEHEYAGEYFYIYENDNKFLVSDKYTTYSYLYAGHPLVYEKTPEYYFYDPFGKIFMNSFMIRPAELPDNLSNEFSENKINNFTNE